METNGLRLHASGSKESRLRKAARISARLQQLRRAAARGSERLYKTGIRPVSGYAMGLHGVSPSEMEGGRKASGASTFTVTKGVSRTARLAYHQEPVADAQIACTAQLLR